MFSGEASGRMWYFTCFLQRAGICCIKKKKKLEKKRAEDKKPGRKEFERNNFLIRDMKAFVTVSLPAFPTGSH